MAVRNVVATAPQPEPASCLRSATRDVSFLRSGSRYRRYVSDLSNVTLRYLVSEQKGRVSLFKLLPVLRFDELDVMDKFIEIHYKSNALRENVAANQI